MTQDIVPSESSGSYIRSKLVTLGIVFVAGWLLLQVQIVLVLVTVVWGLMMTCFAPIMILRVLDRDIAFSHMFIGCVVGILAMLGWTTDWV